MRLKGNCVYHEWLFKHSDVWHAGSSEHHPVATAASYAPEVCWRGPVFTPEDFPDVWRRRGYLLALLISVLLDRRSALLLFWAVHPGHPAPGIRTAGQLTSL